MAKISELTETTTPASSDVVPIVQSGVTKKVQVSNLLNSSNVDINGGTIDGTVIGATTKANGSFNVLTSKYYGGLGLVFTPALISILTFNGDVDCNLAGIDVSASGDVVFSGGTTTITAGTTQTQAGGTALTKYRNIVTTANSDDAVTLMAAAAGLTVMVLNNTANTIRLFPASGDAIGAASADAKLDLTTKTGVLLHAVDATTWIKLSA